MGWTIKQAAEKTGIPADTLRYYEKQGITSTKRHDNGYRQYDEDDISILKNIVVMKYAHFSLAEIKVMEELFTQEASGNCNETCKNILNSKITELRQAIDNYQKIVALMEELLPMIDSLDSYYANLDRIDAFINQIFEDIRNNGSLTLSGIPSSNGSEV